MLLERIAELVISEDYLKIDILLEKLMNDFPYTPKEDIEKELIDFLERTGKLNCIYVEFLLDLEIKGEKYYCFKWELEEGKHLVFDIKETDLVPSNLLIKGDNFTLINSKTKIVVIPSSRIEPKLLDSEIQTSMEVPLKDGTLGRKILTFEQILSLIR